MDQTLLDKLLSEAARNYVAERVREGAYASAGEYLSDLVRRDRDARAAVRLAELIAAGLASGPATPLTAAEVNEIRVRVAAVSR